MQKPQLYVLDKSKSQARLKLIKSSYEELEVFFRVSGENWVEALLETIWFAINVVYAIIGIATVPKSVGGTKYNLG